MMKPPQPCEKCGTRRKYQNDQYRKTQPGSKASVQGYAYERVCAKCVAELFEPQAR